MQLAKENRKFVFTALRKSARGREFESSLQWLSDASMIHQAYAVTKPGFPLKSYAEPGTFKSESWSNSFGCIVSVSFTAWYDKLQVVFVA